VLCLTGAEPGDTAARSGRLRAGLVSITCLLRNLPLFFCAVPATPLRVLCIVALDTIHVLRYSRPLSRQRRSDLATFLDFQACTNAAWDRKPLCAAEYQALQRRLASAGLERWMTEYLCRLTELESRRPPIGGDLRRFDEVRAYREEVARVSLAAVAAIALNAECLEEGIRATHCDGDVAVLFRMAMQCQVVDDVFDYTEDLTAGLPSFLTASASRPQALTLTAHAARSYAASRGRSAGGGVFPLDLALHALTVMTTIVVAAARRGAARGPGEARVPATSGAHSGTGPDHRESSIRSSRALTIAFSAQPGCTREDSTSNVCLPYDASSGT
jgi:hypothetical protein